MRGKVFEKDVISGSVMKINAKDDVSTTTKVKAKRKCNALHLNIHIHKIKFEFFVIFIANP